MATEERAPDAELILRLRARDRSAWEQLYAEYQPRLRAFAYRLSGNVHDADDLVQETFVRAVPRLDREVERVQRHELAVALGQVDRLDHRHARFSRTC